LGREDSSKDKSTPDFVLTETTHVPIQQGRCVVLPAEDMDEPLRIVLWTRAVHQHLPAEDADAFLSGSPRFQPSLLDNENWRQRLRKAIAPQLRDLTDGSRADSALLQLLTDIPESIAFDEVRVALADSLRRRHVQFFERLQQALRETSKRERSTVPIRDQFDLLAAEDHDSIRDFIHAETGVFPEEGEKGQKKSQQAWALQRRLARAVARQALEVSPRMHVLLIPCTKHSGRTKRTFDATQPRDQWKWWGIEPAQVAKATLVMGDPENFMLRCPCCGKKHPLGGPRRNIPE
jgi:hypothetical protein